MQSKTAAPRDSLTDAQIVALVEANALEVDFGVELYDSSESFIEDISEDFLGGDVEHGNFRSIHGTCRLELSRELQWGSQRVKPYVTLTADDVTARFNLGVFLLSTPSAAAGETPRVWEVDGYDKLEVLAHPYGATYRLASGSAVVAAVESLITGAGESKIRIDQTSATVVTASEFLRPIDAQTSTLNICNDLLRLIGYRGLWVDQDGYYRSEPYTSPSSAASEWTYDAQSTSTTVGEDRVSEADYFDTPNKFVFVRDDPGQDLPESGAGLYVVTNQSDGPTSIDSRGRTITGVWRLEAASHAALVTQGDRIVESTKKTIKRLKLTSGINPLHLHFDVCRVKDTELGIDANYVWVSWRLPLDGSDMSHEVKQV